MRGLTFALALLAAAPAEAATLLHPMFADHAVLQRDQPIPVYGTAKPGADVTLLDKGQVMGHVTADQNGDFVISLSELLRVIQFYNSLGLHCQAGTEDGYAPGAGGDTSCAPHDSDYNPQDWVISLSELLRVIQFYNVGSYHACTGSEDNFCLGSAG